MLECFSLGLLARNVLIIYYDIDNSETISFIVSNLAKNLVLYCITEKRSKINQFNL